MNFKLKALVAAVALAAVAGQAAAALPAPATATAQSDLLFYAFDLTSGNSFVYDLGASSLLPTLNQSIATSAWTSYLAAETGSLANTTWGLAYNQGSNAASSLWGTTVTSGNVITTESSSKVSAGRGVFNNFLASTSLTGAGQSAFATGSGFDNIATGFANNWGTNATFTTDNAVGTAADFFTVTAASSKTGGTLVASGISFNGTTVAAVPEPESYAMLLAGLGLMGFIARRRRIV
jgi:hypothetical protein